MLGGMCGSLWRVCPGCVERNELPVMLRGKGTKILFKALFHQKLKLLNCDAIEENGLNIPFVCLLFSLFLNLHSYY